MSIPTTGMSNLPLHRANPWHKLSQMVEIFYIHIVYPMLQWPVRVFWKFHHLLFVKEQKTFEHMEKRITTVKTFHCKTPHFSVYVDFLFHKLEFFYSFAYENLYLCEISRNVKCFISQYGHHILLFWPSNELFICHILCFWTEESCLKNLVFECPHPSHDFAIEL